MVAVSPATAVWRGSKGGTVEIKVNDEMVTIEIDPVKGPKVLSIQDEEFVDSWMPDVGKSWSELDVSKQKLLAYNAARKNREVTSSAEKIKEASRRQKVEKAISAGAEEEAKELRCTMERLRGPMTWPGIGQDKVLQNHSKKSPGMIYGFEFPWNAELLESFGPTWLTKAFHAACTMEPDNKVTSVTLDRNIKIDAGNNAGKFLFEVTYAKPNSILHTMMFAKVPFAMTKETQSDRVSSSVYKQPMDFHEINTYRLMESSLPVKTPKYYYGDISPETSNFILITARIPYAEVGSAEVGKMKMEPYQIEGPYDKCKDVYQLRGPAFDYYRLLVEASAKIAARDKAGKMLPREMQKITGQVAPDTSDKSGWGFVDFKPSGTDPATLLPQLQLGVSFFSDTARRLFPEYVTTDGFKRKFIRTMMTWSAYFNELNYWMHSDPDYVALGHANLNADNAYFWRDEAGQLDCGIIDWGGFAAGPLGHKMWWCFNCADFDNIQESLDKYINVFIEVYQEHGGPKLDKQRFKTQVLLASLGNTMFMVRAVPDCFKMCDRKQWPTIMERSDPRVADNINGKSTLRTTLQVMTNGLRVLQELESDLILEEWIQSVYVGQWGKPEKPRSVILGASDDW